MIVKHRWPQYSSPHLTVRSFGVFSPKEVLERTGWGQFGVSGVKDHADVFGDNGRLDAMVHLQRGDKGCVLDTMTSRDLKTRTNRYNTAEQRLTSRYADKVM